MSIILINNVIVRSVFEMSRVLLCSVRILGTENVYLNSDLRKKLFLCTNYLNGRLLLF